MSKAKRKSQSQESATSNQFSEVEQKAPPKKNSPQKNAQKTTPQTPIPSKINQNFFQRTTTTIYMIVAFIVIIAMGHLYVSILVLLLTYGIYKQVSGIKRHIQKQNEIPMTPFLTWYLYGITQYFIVGKVLLNKMTIQVIKNQFLYSILKYHNFIFFCLLILGFLIFVLSLEKGFMKYQFRIFGWTCLTCLLVVFPGLAMLMNIHEGMCWFLLPTFLIITNDIFAYLVGYFFGKRQLIQLSPKKTWQGYIGGAIITFFFSLVLSHIIVENSMLSCPQHTLNIFPFNYPECKNPLLQYVKIDFKFFEIYPTLLQLHTLVLALFASLIGPFGGFFASGLKRSTKIKDFANIIPGHGGITDRMDCQLMMGAFTYFYLHNIVLQNRNNFSIILNNLTSIEQFELYKILQLTLTNSGIIS